MKDNKVVICGVNTSRLPLMKEEEKIRLVVLSQKGDKKARDRLINGNLRLVLSVIQRFLNRNESADDLFQVGCIGLIKAIDNFNTELGVRFSTYAVPMIIGELRRYMRDNSHVRVSRSLRDLAFRTMQCREQLQSKLGREPSVAQIAQALGEQLADVVCALEAAVDPVSLYEPVYGDGADGAQVLDALRCSEDEKDWISEIGLRDAVDALNERERTILRLRYFCGRTQMQVADEIGISQAQVSRLEKHFLEKIRSCI